MRSPSGSCAREKSIRCWSATLLYLSAYIDGNGGASGTQNVRMALYSDAGGIPGAKIVESVTQPISAGARCGTGAAMMSAASSDCAVWATATEKQPWQ